MRCVRVQPVNPPRVLFFGVECYQHLAFERHSLARLTCEARPLTAWTRPAVWALPSIVNRVRVRDRSSSLEGEGRSARAGGGEDR